MRQLLFVVVSFFILGCGSDLKKADPPQCGNGRVDSGEKCDPGIPSGQPGACPTECEAPALACSSAVLVGDRLACTAECVVNASACGDGDGCCPSGCDSTNDPDCSNTCGDGTVESGETCDGDCPTTCDDRDACTVDSFTGSADTCNLTCATATISACAGGDGCCPLGCTPAQDSDCLATCGNGTLDAGELCDGNCPSNCDDGIACTSDRLVGGATTCNAQCLNDPIAVCNNADGCCPAGCSSANDSDCACVPKTCADMGWTCGTLDTGCNTTVACGQCNGNQSCDGGTCVTVPVSRGIGSPCGTDAECDSGLCFSEAGFGYPGGYCVGQCDVFLIGCDSSPAGGVCDGAACVKGCNVNADCRTGYECYALLGTTPKACHPVGLGARTIGQSCSSSMDCAGGQNATCEGPSAGYRNGYCQKFCDAANACPSGSHCAFDEMGVGVCLRDCASNASCRGSGMDGYLCYDVDKDGAQECFIGGTGTGAVGSPCSGAWDCGGGAWGRCGTEDNGFPDGYCSIGCDTDEGACPTGSHCGTTVASSYCVDDCTSSTQCRPGYTCQDDGTIDACWP